MKHVIVVFQTEYKLHVAHSPMRETELIEALRCAQLMMEEEHSDEYRIDRAGEAIQEAEEDSDES